MKTPKNAVIRARCHSDLKRDVDEVARLQNVDPADIIRKAVLNYVERIRESVRNSAMAN